MSGKAREARCDRSRQRLSLELEEEQASWLGPFRSRLFRRADIARRKRVLDLGAGCGTISRELARRAGGPVLAVDLAPPPNEGLDQTSVEGRLQRVTADAARLPLANRSIDLVFCQAALLWMPIGAVIGELARVVVDGGAVVALEPDYGGMMDFPEGVGLGSVWKVALRRAGGDPCVGRKLPARFVEAGFDVNVQFVPELQAASPRRFAMLSELELTEEEREQVNHADASFATPEEGLVHLPWFGITAIRRR